MKIETGKVLFYFLCIASGVMLGVSCKKKCSAGSGGGLTIVAKMQHHDHYIDNQQNYRDTVYVKYSTQNAPSNIASYDTKFIGDAGTDYVNLTGLKCGDYYFFAVGNDTIFSSGHNTRVSGGTPFSTSQESGSVNVLIAVGE